MQAWLSDPVRTLMRGKTTRANRDTKATGMSEVGSHRITEDENSPAGWTDSPKWAWRRETLGSSSSSAQRRKPSAGGGHRVEGR